MKKVVWLLFFTGILFADATLEINKKYTCKSFMIINGDVQIRKNDRNTHLFNDPDITFEYGSKKSYITSKGKRSLFRYVKSISNGEVYVSETTSALLGVSRDTPVINIVIGDLTLSYGCK